MTVLVEFTISTDRFELGSYVASGDELHAELERIVPTENHAIPYVWATGSAGALDGATSTSPGR